MSIHMNEGNLEIISIQSINWQQSLKKNILLFSIFGTLLLCLDLWGIFSVGFIPEHIFLLILPILLIFYAVFCVDLYFESLIVHNNGFTIGKSKFHMKLFGESKFINFDEVNNIEFLENGSSGDRIEFVLKSNKKIYRAINDQNEYQIIMEAFKNASFVE